VTAYDVPADSSGSTPNDGDDVTLTMTPGQNGAVTFAANADDPISVDFSDVTLGSSSCCSTLVKILKPDGSTLSGTLGYVGTGGGDIDMVTAPTTGSYTVSLDPQAAASGTIKITLHPPKPTTSWYMDSVDYDTLYDLGYGLGQAVLNRTKPQSALVVLDYGCQKIDDDGSTWGAVSINSNVFHSMSGLRNAIEAFGAGYYYGTASNTTAQLTIELGTNNGCRGGSDAGQVWANSVDTINNYFANHPSVDFPFARQVTALGANDIEWDFCMSDGCPTAARGWASGYSSAGNWMYDNFGACSGCQPAGSSPNGPWTQDDYWYVSWGATNALPLPEIYATNGVNAAQWERISEYGLTRHSWAMNFDGAMTQLQACTQKNACITPAGNLGNSASQGWRQLWRALNSKADYDNHVPPTGVHDRLKYSTDIKWEHG